MDLTVRSRWCSWATKTRSGRTIVAARLVFLLPREQDDAAAAVAELRQTTVVRITRLVAMAAAIT